ncbi:disease resistance protein RPP8-like [Coffea arabica]|uniref:Disease resistance protein RPP8-like n=1 Tax=Coffea arabica TaxID=13443 RepID=A0ABM4U0X5_COFAR
MTVDERIKSCRVHDALRELAIRKTPEMMKYQPNPDLENAEMGYNLPKEIGKVRLLRYLGLRRTSIGRLPHSFGCLRNLQTLDIRNINRVIVSNFIWKLESLRHLYAYKMECDVPLKIEGLRNLQTLSGIRFDDIMHNNMITLTSLQKLGIWVDDGSDIGKLCMHLSEVGSLKTLRLYCNVRREWPTVCGLSKLHHVTELKLCGMGLTTLPPDFPSNLSRLSLSFTRLEHDPMPALEKLGQLSFLKMEFSYWEPQLVISTHGFHQLKFLELNFQHGLKEIKVEKGALPQLQCLRIRKCLSLEKLPEELKYISTLEKLELVDMPEDLISRLDADMISSIPNLRIF